MFIISTSHVTSSPPKRKGKWRPLSKSVSQVVVQPQHNRMNEWSRVAGNDEYFNNPNVAEVQKKLRRQEAEVDSGLRHG